MGKLGWSLFLCFGVVGACSGKSSESHRGKDEAPYGGTSTGGLDAAGEDSGARPSGGAAGNRTGGAGGDLGGGGSGASSGIAGQGDEGGAGGADDCGCKFLIGVRTDADVACVNGFCQIDPSDCRDGRADCDGNALDGCETRIDLDLSNCGTCGTVCLDGRRCFDGHCAFDPCIPGYDHCNDDESCTPLDTEDDCGACGHAACVFANATATCSSGTACKPPLCSPGFANCSGNHACETPVTSSGSGCFPTVLSTVTLEVEGPNVHAAVGTDGATILGGTFLGSPDFDPTSGVDIHESFSSDGSAFITKLAPNGDYAWTRSFDGGFSWISSVKVAGDGSIVAMGGYEGSLDLDPGPGEDRHDTSNIEAFVVKLHADGSLAWSHRFPTTDPSWYSSSADVALDAQGAIYATGEFVGTVDFDPSAPGGERTTDPLFGAPNEPSSKAYLVKLSSDGAFTWVFSHSGGGRSNGDGLSVAGNRVWLAGSVSGSAEFDEASSAVTTATTYGSYVLDLTLGGGFGSFGLLDDTQGGARVATTPSSVYLWGVADASADLDPSAGVDQRTTPEGNTFIVKLDATGAFEWSQTLGRYKNFLWPDIATTTSGGVLVPATGPWNPDFSPSAIHGALFLVNDDSSPGFTLDLGTHAAPLTVATGGGLLVVAGHVEDDLYAMTGTGRFFVTRYAFP